MTQFTEAETAYQKTIERLEPNITPVDADATLASIAISLRRIADSLDTMQLRIEGLASNVGFLSMRGPQS